MHMAEAYKKMWEYEQHNKMKYDYVMRHRTDIILDNKLDFRWMYMTVNEIEDSLSVIQQKCKQVLTEEEQISYFMNTLISNHPDIDIGRCINYFTNDVLKIECTAAEKIKKILEDDNFALLQVYDLSYIISRKNYYVIPFSGVASYGYMCDQTDDFVWWTSESQLFYTLKHINVNIFNNLYCKCIPPTEIDKVCKDTKGLYFIKKREDIGVLMASFNSEAPTVVTEILEDYNLKLFKCPNPVVIYTPVEAADSIRKFHHNYGLSPVRIIKIPANPQYNLSFYLQHAINNNFTKSDQFIWVNPNATIAKSIYIDRVFMKQYTKIKICQVQKKIKICQLQYLNSQIIASEDYVTKFKDVVSTDFISGHKQQMLLLCKTFDILSQKLLSQGYNPLPEIIIGIIIVLYPDMFDVYYGDTENVLNNIGEYRGGEQAIRTMLSEAEKYRDVEFKQKVYKSIRGSIFNHLIPTV